MTQHDDQEPDSTARDIDQALMRLRTQQSPHSFILNTLIQKAPITSPSQDHQSHSITFTFPADWPMNLGSMFSSPQIALQNAGGQPSIVGDRITEIDDEEVAVHDPNHTSTHSSALAEEPRVNDFHALLEDVKAEEKDDAMDESEFNSDPNITTECLIDDPVDRKRVGTSTKSEYEAKGAELKTDPAEDESSLLSGDQPKPPLKRSRPDSPDFKAPAPIHDRDGPPAKRLRQRPNKQSKSAQEDFRQEEELSMKAGIEAYLATHDGDGTKKKKRKSKALQETKPGKNKLTKKNASNNLQNLLPGRVLEGANIAEGQQAQAPATEQDRSRALKQMVKNAPRSEKEQAKRDQKELSDALTTLGKGKFTCITVDERSKWAFDGMQSSLFHHQVIGAAFMKKREKSGIAPFGGIMAYTMGLGKTVMTVCLMIAHPPPSSEPLKSTLIVCPPGLVKQWEQEINKHAPDLGEDGIWIYKKSQNPFGKDASTRLQRANVVIASYHEILRSYPKPDVPKDIKNFAQLKQWWEERWDDVRGDLHRAHFYRIVIDESQIMKNYTTQISLACRALMAKYRWALSGTPIMNGVDELYPYFKFLRVPQVETYDDFVDTFCVPGSEDCNERLHTLLDSILIRRSHADHLFGAPLVQLPKNYVQTETLAFSQVEKAVYYLMVKHLVGKLNEASEDGTLEEHPGITIESIVRLRQAASHIFQAQDILDDFLEPYHLDAISSGLIGKPSPANRFERDQIAALRRFLKMKHEEAERQSRRDKSQSKGPFQDCSSLIMEFQHYIHELQDEKNFREWSNRVKCQACSDPPQEPVVTSCFHVYCEECLENIAMKASSAQNDRTSCVACHEVFESSEPCKGLPELDLHQFRKAQNLETHKTWKKTRPVDIGWVKYDKQLILSTKLRWAREQVRKWLDDTPDDKIIIFSQWHMSMRLLEEVCKVEAWGHSTIHGKVSMKKRSEIIQDFQENPETQVMIVSMKCGGTGLNLTMANRVLHIDLWFNQSAEEQAFCRVFRIGQAKETYIRRLLVDNSIDVKLEEMQIAKSAQIANAIELQDVVAKMSTEEIFGLFGAVRRKGGKSFIHMEEDDHLDELFAKHATEYRKVGGCA